MVLGVPGTIIKLSNHVKHTDNDREQDSRQRPTQDLTRIAEMPLTETPLYLPTQRWFGDTTLGQPCIILVLNASSRYNIVGYKQKQQ